MAVRPVVIWPDSRLREETREVTEFGEQLHQLYRDLADTMYAQNGLGIAAPQIGAPVKMFLVEPALAGRAAEDPPVACINPEVVWTGDEVEKADEGCLSFPGIYVPIERPLRARIRARDLEGNTFELEGEGLLARCLLHENDHLTGKLMVDFVGPLKKQMIKRKLKRDASDSAAAG
jgi:peptide deformylase